MSALLFLRNKSEPATTYRPTSDIFAYNNSLTTNHIISHHPTEDRRLAIPSLDREAAIPSLDHGPGFHHQLLQPPPEADRGQPDSLPGLVFLIKNPGNSPPDYRG